ncbi:hypothetical protein C0J52_01736 [Blattella germanica]|nr:hypothetical protein C0J52_01736 [Blattella germanica]
MNSTLISLKTLFDSKYSETKFILLMWNEKLYNIQNNQNIFRADGLWSRYYKNPTFRQKLCLASSIGSQCLGQQIVLFLTHTYQFILNM